jgi:photoactive yellow protein
MKKECMSCKRVLAEGSQANGISHGLCTNCFLNRFSEIPPDQIVSQSQQMANMLPYATVVLDGRLCVIAFNNEAARLWGVMPQWMLGHSFFDEIAPSANIEAFQGLAAANVKSVTPFIRTFEFKFQFSGIERLLEVTLKSGHGRVALVLKPPASLARARTGPHTIPKSEKPPSPSNTVQIMMDGLFETRPDEDLTIRLVIPLLRDDSD